MIGRQSTTKVASVQLVTTCHWIKLMVSFVLWPLHPNTNLLILLFHQLQLFQRGFNFVRLLFQICWFMQLWREGYWTRWHFLKSVAEELANPLTYIFNLSLQSGTIPSAWKRSNITPVHKGGSCDDPGNFRLISVVPITAKMLEKLISFQHSSYLEDHGLLHDHQGAYRCGHSADQIVLFVTDIVTCALDKGSTVCAAFLDLRKVFDSLDHAILLDRLYKLVLSCCDFVITLLIDSRGSSLVIHILNGGLFWVGSPKVVHWDHFYF